MKVSSVRPGILRFLIARSGGPQAQRPLTAGAPPGRVRELLNPDDQRAGEHQPGGLRRGGHHEQVCPPPPLFPRPHHTSHLFASPHRWPLPASPRCRPPDRFSSSTEQSSASRLLKRHRRRRKQRPPRLERVRGSSRGSWTLEKQGPWLRGHRGTGSETPGRVHGPLEAAPLLPRVPRRPPPSAASPTPRCLSTSSRSP